MDNEIARLTKEVTDRHRKTSELFEKLKNAKGMAAQKMIMFEIYQLLLDHNSQLWDENMALRTRLRNITIN